MRESTPAKRRPETRALLEALARRVRLRRETLGWTQAELAGRAALSVRFLARVESGEGNISVARLDDLAHALGLEVAELLRPGVPRGRSIALVGMRGAGKSTVGPLLAETVGVPFVEMDDRILDAVGVSLDQLFELHGEEYYRRLERETLEHLLAEGERVVLAAAGGVVNEPRTWKTLLGETVVVWLAAKPEDHWRRVVAQGDRRPMGDRPDAMHQLRAMLAAREPSYRQAHVVVDTSGRSPERVTGIIREKLAEIVEG